MARGAVSEQQHSIRPPLTTHHSPLATRPSPHTTTSINGTRGTSPASKAERSMSSSSVSKRTGTSNSKPAVTAAPGGGGAAKTTRPVVGSHVKAGADRLLDPRDRDPHGAANRLLDRPQVGRVRPPVGLGELERLGGAVAGADRLVGGAGRLRRRARAAIGAVAEAEAVQAPAPFLEEGDHRVQRVERADAEAGVVAPARARPAGVAVLAARRQGDDVGAPHRAAAAAEADVEREADLVEIGRHAGPPAMGGGNPGAARGVGGAGPCAPRGGAR